MLNRIEFCFILVHWETINIFSCYLLLKPPETYLLSIMPVQRDKKFILQLIVTVGKMKCGPNQNKM